jgi:deoxyribodipyrimidine photolyase-related protein
MAQKNTNIAIIFPHQLFEIKYITYDVSSINIFLIVEDTLFFSDKVRKLHFNMLKLIYQRASMKYYETYLSQKGFNVKYMEWENDPNFWIKYIKQNYGNGSIINIIDPIDKLLESRINSFSSKFNQIFKYHETPAFLSSKHDLIDYTKYIKNQNHYSQYSFYIWQRKRMNILLDKNNKPIGSKYSFDKYNRKAIPEYDFSNFLTKNKIKLKTASYTNIFYDAAIKYCENKFHNYYPNNYQPENIYLYPITHKDIKKHFANFLSQKIQYFGDYQDAIDFSNCEKNPQKSKDFFSLFHSVISPQLNNGLLTPVWVLSKIMSYWKINSRKKQTLLHSIEGFIRQLNWREYSRFLYLYAYDKMKGNYFNNTRRLTKKWYTGKTGILPIDNTINIAFRYGYIHHILRLMIMCNFMNLCRIHPDDVYKWFMEFSLDSYDWVMINNVYSMGLYADGGLTTTRPYISSSNYVRKQSNLKYQNWSYVWDVLYYYFVYVNQNKFKHRGFIYKNSLRRIKNVKLLKDEGKYFINLLTK